MAKRTISIAVSITPCGRPDIDQVIGATHNTREAGDEIHYFSTSFSKPAEAKASACTDGSGPTIKLFTIERPS